MSNKDEKPTFQRRNGPMQIVEKPKNFKKSIIDILKYCKSHLPIVIISLILAVIGAVLSLLWPNKLGDLTNVITNGLLTGIDMSEVLSIGLFLIVIFTTSGVFNYVQAYLMVGVTQKVSKKLRKEIATKINMLPLKYLDSHPYGDTLSRVTNDVDTIGQSLSNSVTSLISNSVLLLGCIVMMFITNWLMAITAIFASLVGFVAMFAIMAKSQKFFVAQQKNIGDLNGHIEENYTNHTIVKAYNGSALEKQVFTKYNKKHL